MFNDFAKKVNEEALGVYTINVFQKGKGDSSHFFRTDERCHLYSGSKAFVSAAVGIAEHERLLKLTDRVIDFFPQYKSLYDPNYNITITDLLQMCGGHGASLFSSDESTHDNYTDWAELFFKQKYNDNLFFYDNGCTYMLSRIIEEVSGTTLRDYLIPRLFKPLGIHNPQWHTCPKGHTLGAIGLYLRAAEYGRLGKLLLQKGEWEGKQILSPEYVFKMANDTVETRGYTGNENICGYGYQLWRCSISNAYRADGKFGQFCVVLEDYDAVVSVTAHNEKNCDDILDAIWQCIVPKL